MFLKCNALNLFLSEIIRDIANNEKHVIDLRHIAYPTDAYCSPNIAYVVGGKKEKRGKT